MPEPNSENHHPAHHADPNPFVAFRRFADEQFASIFNEQDRLLRFVSNYERATNPERRQIEPRDHGDLKTMGADKDKSEREVDMLGGREGRRDAGGPGFFDRALGMLGKTSASEEIARAKKLKTRNAGGVVAPRADENAPFRTPTFMIGGRAGDEITKNAHVVQGKGLQSDGQAVSEPDGGIAFEIDGRTYHRFHPSSWQRYDSGKDQKTEPVLRSWGPIRETVEGEFEKMRDEMKHLLLEGNGPKDNKGTGADPILRTWEPSRGKYEGVSEDIRKEVAPWLQWVQGFEEQAKQSERRLESQPLEQASDQYEPMEEGGPYDPRRLAADERTRYQAPWLGAFEDLAAKHDDEKDEYEYDGICPWLREEAALDRHQKQKDDYDHDDGREYNGVCPFLREGRFDDFEYDEHDTDDPHDRELDYYERREASSQSMQHQRQQAHQRGAWLEAGLVESLTNVERKLMPDGTVVTKRTTKLRFEDGSEEVRNESEAHSAREAGLPEPRSPGDTRSGLEEDRTDLRLSDVGKKVGMREQIEAKRRRASGDGGKGWFW